MASAKQTARERGNRGNVAPVPTPGTPDHSGYAEPTRAETTHPAQPDPDAAGNRAAQVAANADDTASHKPRAETLEAHGQGGGRSRYALRIIPAFLHAMASCQTIGSVAEPRHLRCDSSTEPVDKPVDEIPAPFPSGPAERLFLLLLKF